MYYYGVGSGEWKIGNKYTIYNGNPACPQVVFENPTWEIVRYEDLSPCDGPLGYSIVNENILHENAVIFDEGDHCEDNWENILRACSNTIGDDYVFMETNKGSTKQSGCQYSLASKVQKLQLNGNSRLFLFNKSCLSDTNVDESISSCPITEKSDGKLFIVLGATIPSFLVICFMIFATICLVKKGVICDKKEEDAIVHQNELYGNLSNEDYFEERYDTNVVDTNENYQQYEEYEA